VRGDELALAGEQRGVAYLPSWQDADEEARQAPLQTIFNGLPGPNPKLNFHV